MFTVLVCCLQLLVRKVLFVYFFVNIDKYSTCNNLFKTFIFIELYILSCFSVASNSSQCHGLQPSRLLCPWNFAGKNTRVGCHFLLQGIFPSQGSNLHLWHLLLWQTDSFPLCPWGSPFICITSFICHISLRRTSASIRFILQMRQPRIRKDKSYSAYPDDQLPTLFRYLLRSIDTHMQMYIMQSYSSEAHVLYVYFLWAVGR